MATAPLKHRVQLEKSAACAGAMLQVSSSILDLVWRTALLGILTRVSPPAGCLLLGVSFASAKRLHTNIAVDQHQLHQCIVMPPTASCNCLHEKVICAKLDQTSSAVWCSREQLAAKNC